MILLETVESAIPAIAGTSPFGERGSWYLRCAVIEPTIPPDEAKRLALLKACRILYTPAEEAYDDIAQLAADLCGTEIALITLVDADYQWFKARVGIAQTRVPRDLSFCGALELAGTPGSGGFGSSVGCASVFRSLRMEVSVDTFAVQRRHRADGLARARRFRRVFDRHLVRPELLAADGR